MIFIIRSVFRLVLVALPLHLAFGLAMAAHDVSDYTSPQSVESFIVTWEKMKRADRDNAEKFARGLCDLLHVARPDSSDKKYRFSYFITVGKPGGPLTSGCIDLYKHDCFLWMSATDEKIRTSSSEKSAMAAAHKIGTIFAKYLKEKPPFLLVVDIGRAIDVYADFNGKGNYAPFPSAGENRISLKELRKESVRDLLRAIWQNPYALAPTAL